jgi:hypothetical protein
MLAPPHNLTPDTNTQSVLSEETKKSPKPKPNIPFTPIADNKMQDIIYDSIPIIQQKVEQYLRKDCQLPLWELKNGSAKMKEHIASLKIPKLGEKSIKPSLLLHNLNEGPNDPELERRIKELFIPGPGTR